MLPSMMRTCLFPSLFFVDGTWTCIWIMDLYVDGLDVDGLCTCELCGLVYGLCGLVYGLCTCELYVDGLDVIM